MNERPRLTLHHKSINNLASRPASDHHADQLSTHFQMKTLKHVGTEMALHVQAYNMKRVMSILGFGGLANGSDSSIGSAAISWSGNF